MTISFCSIVPPSWTVTIRFFSLWFDPDLFLGYARKADNNPNTPALFGYLNRRIQNGTTRRDAIRVSGHKAFLGWNLYRILGNKKNPISSSNLLYPAHHWMWDPEKCRGIYFCPGRVFSDIRYPRESMISRLESLVCDTLVLVQGGRGRLRIWFRWGFSLGYWTWHCFAVGITPTNPLYSRHQDKDWQFFRKLFQIMKTFSPSHQREDGILTRGEELHLFWISSTELARKVIFAPEARVRQNPPLEYAWIQTWIRSSGCRCIFFLLR